jgi:fermentation-respiration switch protein FrsA (DUF1100 family)
MPMNKLYPILLILITAAGCYFFFPQIESFFIFYPQRHLDQVPSDVGLKADEVFFQTSDRTKLHGWYFDHEQKGPVLLFCHGNAGNISHRLGNIKLLLDAGLRVFIFDYRGYGKSGGKPSERGLYRDGLAAYDFLVHQKRIPRNRIVPFGRSLGAAVAVEIALRREVRSLIIESAFTSTKEMAKSIWLFWPISFLVPPHYDNLSKIPQISVPVLIIHGQQDGIVPFPMGKRLHAAAPMPKHFLPLKGAGHNDTYIIGGSRYFQSLAGFAKKGGFKKE